MREVKEFKVLITETRQKTVVVKAASEGEAHRRAEDAWKNAEYVLGAESFQGVEFHVAGGIDGGSTDKLLERIEQKGGEPDA